MPFNAIKSHGPFVLIPTLCLEDHGRAGFELGPSGRISIPRSSTGSARFFASSARRMKVSSEISTSAVCRVMSNCRVSGALLLLLE